MAFAGNREARWATQIHEVSHYKITVGTADRAVNPVNPLKDSYSYERYMLD